MLSAATAKALGYQAQEGSAVKVSGRKGLGVKADGTLCVCSTPNQDNPIMKGVVDCLCQPIVGLDVWEHAYYLHYQNRRPDYVNAWWNVVNWTNADEWFGRAR